MTALKETEARVAWALKQVAEGVEVSTADQRRVEDQYRQLLASGRQGLWRGRRPRAVAVAAACLVLAVALAAVVLIGRPAQRPVPVKPVPPTLTSAYLVGVWQPMEYPKPKVLVIAADGRFEELTEPSDLFLPEPRDEYSFSLQGSTLVATGAMGNVRCTGSWRTTVIDHDRFQTQWTGKGTPCLDDWNPSPWWVDSEMVRLVPPPAAPPISKFLGSMTTLDQVRWLSSVRGTWLLTGTDRLLAVVDDVQGSTTRAHYIVVERPQETTATGRRIVAERGVVTIEPGGVLVFQPQDGTCPRRYAAKAEFSTLDARVAAGSCGRLGGTVAPWIRLN
jgi:hypothetical protein